MRLRPTIIAVIIGLYAVPALAQKVESDSALDAANRLYNAGSYESAELAARRRIEQAPIADSIRVEAERIIAFSLVAQAKPALAREHFETILSLEPAFSLDAILTSPKILTVFQEAKIHSTATRKPGTADATTREGEVTAITYRTVLFPGWEQLHQGRDTPGLVFGGAGVLTLGSAITFEFLRAPARRDYLAATQPSDISNKYDKYNRMYRGEVYSLVAFAAVYIASEFDVFLNPDPPMDIHAASNRLGGSDIVLSFHF